MYSSHFRSYTSLVVKTWWVLHPFKSHEDTGACVSCTSRKLHFQFSSAGAGARLCSQLFLLMCWFRPASAPSPDWLRPASSLDCWLCLCFFFWSASALLEQTLATAPAPQQMATSLLHPYQRHRFCSHFFITHDSTAQLGVAWLLLTRSIAAFAPATVAFTPLPTEPADQVAATILETA